MSKVNAKESFVVNTEPMAKAILCLTDFKFEKFINNEGKTRYAFPREEIIFEAYNLIQDFKHR